MHNEPNPPEDNQTSPKSENIQHELNPETNNHQVVSGGHSTWGSVRTNKVVLLVAALLCGVVGTIYLVSSRAEAPVPPQAAESKPSFVASGDTPEFVPDSVLLKFKDNVPAATQNGIIERYGSVRSEIPQIKVKEITVPEEARDAVITALSHNPAVQFAEKNFTAKAVATSPTTISANDTYYGSQWDITKTQANSAWTLSQGIPQVVIADVDTGADFTHPDLKAKLLTSGYDYINNDANPSDDQGHGTSTAGIIGASTNNATGIAGLCWNCMILPVKALNSSGSGGYSGIASAITYAADHGAKIINLSLGGSSASATLENAVNYAHNKGAILVAAAGNNGTTAYNYPGAYAATISVVGTTSTDKRYSWSSYGSWVDVAAPGCDYATTLGGGYKSDFCGTSAATPVVSGIAGLLWSAKPTASNTQIEQAIFNTTDSCCAAGEVIHGRVNAYKAIQALGATTGGDTTAPTASISAPANGATVSGKASVTVNASDNVAVAKVELYRNGTLFATTTTSPYSFVWDTTASVNGLYTLSSKAYDAAGNVGTSTNVSITVSNSGTDTTAPTVTISQPSSGATITGKQVISASATDGNGVAEMGVYIDGVLKQTSTSGSVSYSWNAQAGNVKPGAHTITIKAYDAAGNVGVSSITITK